VFPTPHYEDISLAEWLAHTPSRLVEEHLQVGEDFLNKISKTETVLAPE
jgi:oxalate decarboxylase